MQGKAQRKDGGRCVSKHGTSLDKLIQAIQDSWSIETSYGNMATAENPARGQCVVSSLVVQDYLGGDLVRVSAKGEGIDEKHYFNVLDDGTVIDATRQQYDNVQVTLTPVPVDLQRQYASIREKLLSDDDTAKRYEILKQQVIENISKNIPE